MKRITLQSLLFTCVIAVSLGFNSCKNKSKETKTNVENTNSVNTAPVDQATDEALTKNVQDATKDYPEVQASVTNGEITIAGSIERDRLQRLMPTLQSLNAKKINNLLVVK